MIHFCKVFDKFREERLLLNLKKCSFVKSKLVYLGFVVLVEGLKIDLEKVKDILEWLLQGLEVRFFHGLASFYKKSI